MNNFSPIVKKTYADIWSCAPNWAHNFAKYQYFQIKPTLCQCYNAYFPILNFWARFGGKMGVAAMRAPKGLVLQSTAKYLAINHVLRFFRSY